MFKEGKIMRRSLIFVLAILMLSCGEKSKEPPSEQELKTYFSKNQEKLDFLSKEIRRDLSEGSTFYIGPENQNILKLSDERFNYFQTELQKLNVNRVTYYNNEVKFTVFSQGMVFAGCSTTIQHLPVSKPFKPAWANPYIEVNLAENWYGVTTCN